MTSYISPQVANMYIRNCLETSTTNYQKSMEQLSSGNKYTSMGDDPYWVSQATKLEVGIKFNSNIQSNLKLGSDMLTTAAGYQDNILTNIQRIRDLTVQANTGTYSDQDKIGLVNEIQARLNNINDLSKTVEFNKIKILDGSVPDLSLKIGPSVNDNINIGSVLIDVSTGAGALDIDLTVPMTNTDWSNYLGKLDAASTLLTNSSANIGAISNRLDSVSDNLTATNQDLTEFKSIVSDTDTAEVSAELVKYQILQQASTNIFVQTNKVNQMVYSLIGASS